MKGPTHPNWGEKNPAYKGSIKYEALHAWVRRRKPKPELCDQCEVRPAEDLANISGNYLRKLDDWEYLCRRCHMEKDGRSEKLRQSGLSRKRFTFCNFCGSKFYALRKQTRFCSKKCFGAHHANRRSVQT
jgi:hypothetical protein